MAFSEYDQYDGLGLAELVAGGQVTAQELCQEAISRIKASGPELNAVVTPLFEQGLKAADDPPPGPFAGVPLLVKDLSYAVAGVPYTQGCKALKNFMPAQDSEMVTRFKKAGAILLGKTNTPEFGLLAVTEPELFGPCRNPWDKTRTPGGSSGGSGAAVAGGLTPLAAGGDGGGSIRIPSSYCGLFGLKPSRGRNPLGPTQGQEWRGAVADHVLTRSVRDSAAMLDATCGPDVGAPYIIAPPAGPYLQEVDEPPKKLRIALSTASPMGTEVHPDCVAAAEQAGKLFEELGHTVEPATPEVDGLALANSYLTLYFGEMAAHIHDLRKVLGRKATPADVEPLTWTLALLGESYSAGYMIRALGQWDTAARAMGRFFEKYDLYLTPTTAQPPAKIGELAPQGAEAKMITAVNTLRAGWLLKASGMVDQMATRSLSRTPFTQLANLTGLPAMSLPLHWGADHLPYGAQVVAPFGAEDLLFRLAGQAEKARPWFNRTPGASS